METLNKIRQCKQAPLCKVAVDGKCIEGLELDICPHMFFIDQPSDSAPDETKIKVPGIKLLSGEELKLENLHIITNNFHTKRIFIIGESDSGKTTLLVRLYNSFQLGPFDQYLFAGSLSLIGFERRCHLSKVESNNDKEQTEKTKSKEFGFLHLASGERIRLARNSSTEMKELGVPLKFSARILMVIDGAKVADRKQRLSAIIDTQTFLRQALDDGVINKSHRIRIVLSKWDLLYNRSDFSFEKDIVTPFQKAFSDRIGDLKFFRLAARPENPIEIQPGYGMIDLLEDWVNDDERQVNRSCFNSIVESDRMVTKFRAY
jgi:hypothetical protein